MDRTDSDLEPSIYDFTYIVLSNCCFCICARAILLLLSFIVLNISKDTLSVVLPYLKSRRISCSVPSEARVLLGPEGLLMR